MTFSQIKNEIYEDFIDEYLGEFEDYVTEKNEKTRRILLKRVIRESIEFTLSHPAIRDA